MVSPFHGTRKHCGLIRHVMYTFVLLFAMCASGLCSYDVSPLIECLTPCAGNETCTSSCTPLINDINLHPQVDEDAAANTSLLCTSAEFMEITFNTGIYIIERIASKYTWSFPQAATGNFATLMNLTAGTEYRFRLYRLTNEGISRPEMTDWVSTFEIDYVPLPVRNISLVKYKTDETKVCSLHAEFLVEPAEDHCCSYNLINWDGEQHIHHFYLEKIRMFRVEIVDLDFGSSNNLTISSYNKEKLSSEMYVMFETPTCLEYYGGNLSICAPNTVKGLRIKDIHVDKRFYDVQVSWEEPTYKPDNYTVEIDFPLEDVDSIIESVPGSKTNVSFSNIEVKSQYTVYIAAESMGGLSPWAEVTRTINSNATINKSYRELTITGMTTLITIAILIGVIYGKCCKNKTKNFSVECSRFEGLSPKDVPKEITTKLLRKTYGRELSNNPLIQDKFELCSQLLKLHGVLGSGAYGIVKLGSLQDEFGNDTDVAVKMLKENPSTEDIQNFHKEILIMKCAGRHPNVVSLIGCCTLHNMPVLVVEYCCKGDLQTYLKMIWQYMVSVPFDHGARFEFDGELYADSDIEYLPNNSGGDEQNYQNIHIIANRLYDIQQDLIQCPETVTASDLLNFARQIATGMEFLSSNRIIHRDLAARNVLVCADRIVKISDFGLSRDIYQENLYRKQGNGKLPLKWMAIEALTHQIYTTHSDVWSFGILLWEIVTMGAVPYPGIPTNAILKLLKSGYRMERPPSCGFELYNIMCSCWHARPQARPTFTELQGNLDKLLTCQSNIKYLNMDEILYDNKNYYRAFVE